MNQWFIAALRFCGTLQGKVLNWRGIVVDSAIGGSKKWFPSVSSALWLRGTMPGKTINWLGVVVDSAIGG